MNNVRERIIAFIKFLGITVSSFEKEIGVSNGYIKNISRSIQPPILENISKKYPQLDIEWLLVGNGDMIKVENVFLNPKELAEYLIAGIPKKESILKIGQTRPRVPYTAAAGSLTSSVDGVTDLQCEQIPLITAFPTYDFTILIKGDSMYPNYEGGDEVACKRIDSTSFIQWGKVHVMDTTQGILIKRVYEDGEDIKCVSYNKEYPDFTVAKNEVYSMSLVVGLLRL